MLLRGMWVIKDILDMLITWNIIFEGQNLFHLDPIHPSQFPHS